MRPFVTASLSIVLITSAVIGIPAALGSVFHKGVQVPTQSATATGTASHKKMPDPKQDVPIHLYLTHEHRMVTIPLEQYVKGVVAAEMPIQFQTEALKAQAVAARTNAVKLLLSGKKTPEGADITDDYHSTQAYRSDQQLKESWGATYDSNMEKVTNAVADTQTEILSFQNQPIDAKFFSTSNGATESNKAYWGDDKPYLQSVSCPWDLSAPHHTDTLPVPLGKVLVAATGKETVPSVSQAKSPLQILQESASHRVEKVRVGDSVLTGADFRSRLSEQGIPLYSTDFSFSVSGGNVTFITHGYGHGVGMSQYGADGMAKEGKSYQEILRYFYKDVQIEAYSTYLKK